MTRDLRSTALEKIAFGFGGGRPASDEGRFRRLRRRAGNALMAGGASLHAAGAAEQAIAKYRMNNKLRDAPKSTIEELMKISPQGLPVISEEDKIREAILPAGYSEYPWLQRKLIEMQANRMTKEIVAGRNSAYLNRLHGRFPNGAVLATPGGMNESVFRHEIGHRNADFSREFPDSYAWEISDARTEDFPTPADMFRTRNTTDHGKYTLPGLEREAWDKAPPGTGPIDQGIRDAALETYDAARRANAKRFYGSVLLHGGSLLRPKKPRPANAPSGQIPAQRPR